MTGSPKPLYKNIIAITPHFSLFDLFFSHVQCAQHSHPLLIEHLYKEYLNAGGEEGRQMLPFITTLCMQAKQILRLRRDREEQKKKRKEISMPVEATLTEIVASEIKSNSQ